MENIGRHELIVMKKVGSDISTLLEYLNKLGILLHPIFDVDEKDYPDLSAYYNFMGKKEKLENLSIFIREHNLIEATYIKPPTYLPKIPNETLTSETPDYSMRQVYLNAPPVGINAYSAWTIPGGKGTGVNIIDIEGGWRNTHEDLTENNGGVVAGQASTDPYWENHGTAVLGVVSGDENSYGIKGICPDSHVMEVSHMRMGSARAIFTAARKLKRGDIIILEMHRPGPRYDYEERIDQKGYIAVEWWPDDFAAIKFATDREIIIVEAAGNGEENLDDSIYDIKPEHFPDNWSNPFDRRNRDCLAVVVGAGAPPPGTHGRNWGNDRSRLSFSNYGKCVDVQGWGYEVTTTGYGDLSGTNINKDLWYTDNFGGTSSASPIVAGAIACTQGTLIVREKEPMKPADVRHYLNISGSPQQDEPSRPASQRIGNRPDIMQIIKLANENNPDRIV
ncbi:S8 family serine peptidase [Paenibacillus sp. 102]|uniref:S8 family serine peptidase n=1 Tax=Paenibacillus sp. 102 TaxID=3120823 RepID=UPI0031B9CA02